MVATKRNSTRGKCREEGSKAEQATMEDTHRTLRRDAQSEENDDVKDHDDNDIPKLRSQIVTRSRHHSEQSNADASEAESTASNSSTRITRSGKTLGHITDTPRKLRSRPSTLMTEPIIESQEGELSEAESNCSSLSARARRRPARNVTRSVKKRNLKPALGSEPLSDHSEAESDCSSVPGVQYNVTRSTRGIKIKHPSVRENQPLSSEETDCVSETKRESSEEQETIQNSRRSLRVTTLSDLSSVAEHSILSSPRRSMRNRAVIQRDIQISVHESQSTASPSKVPGVAQSENNDVPVSKDDVGLTVEVNAVNIVEMSMSQPTEKENVPDQIIDLVEDLTDEEESKKQIHCRNDKSSQANEGTSKDRELAENKRVLELAEDEVPVMKEEKQDSGLVREEDREMEEVCIDSVGGENKTIEEEDREMEECNESEEETKLMEKECNKSTEEEVIEVESEEEEEEVIEVESEEEEEVRELLLEDSEEEDSEEEEVEVVDEVTSKQLEKLKKSSTQKLQDLAKDGLFVIDTTPGLDSNKKYYVEPEENDIEEEDEESENEEPSKPTDEDDEIEELFNRPKSGLALSSTIDTGLDIKKLGGLYISFDAEKPRPGPSFFNKMKNENKKKDELLKNSVMTPGFEKKEAIPPYKESQRQLKKKRKAEREKSTGQGWFDMKAPEMTEELKNDLKALKMRSAMDPKHFYKKSDRDGFPKYFQVGTVVDNPVDFYHSRIPKKQRKRTIVDELLADAEFRRYNKKKYQEIMVEKAARAEGKKKRRKKKFST